MNFLTKIPYSSDALKNLTTHPGVYQMFDEHDHVIYVGKALNLKKRVSSYFSKSIKDSKTKTLLEHVFSIQIIITQTEKEALLLESHLIKKYGPRYNIVFRDDKSYPYLVISSDLFPRLHVYRGSKKQKGRYFGPYPNGFAVRETLNLLQKLFRIRTCKNTFFRSRSRSCLLHQIKRCSAPCVGLISKEDYAKDIQNISRFLEGKGVVEPLQKNMEEASKNLQYELAAKYRDQIKYLRDIQAKQYIDTQYGDADVIALIEKHGMVCINLLMIRNGQVLGNKAFFLGKSAIFENSEEKENDKKQNILETFIAQYYINMPYHLPKEIILNQKPQHIKLLKEILSDQADGELKIKVLVRGQRLSWLRMSILNAEQALENRLMAKTTILKKFISLQQALSLPQIPKRMVCFDVSHTMGEATVASCVVFNEEGALKNQYRRFNIANVTKGDDFAAMYQALKRYFASLKTKLNLIPDILIVDGGKGQLSKAEAIVSQSKLKKKIILLGIAKDPSRKSGLEKIYMAQQKQPLNLSKHAAAFHLIQQIRDEAHRFAIIGHRAKQRKHRKHSILEAIEGVGSKRRQALLKHFGGLQGVKKAGIEALSKVSGINKELAKRIYENLH